MGICERDTLDGRRPTAEDKVATAFEDHTVALRTSASDTNHYGQRLRVRLHWVSSQTAGLVHYEDIVDGGLRSFASRSAPPARFSFLL